MIKCELSRDTARTEFLEKVLGAKSREFIVAAQTVLNVPSIANARLICRIVNRLHLLGVSGVTASELIKNDDPDIRLLVVWLAICERWPQLRFALQEAGDVEDFKTRFGKACTYASTRDGQDPPRYADIASLDAIGIRQNFDLCQFLKRLRDKPKQFRDFESRCFEIDRVFQRAGL